MRELVYTEIRGFGGGGISVRPELKLGPCYSDFTNLAPWILAGTRSGRSFSPERDYSTSASPYHKGVSCKIPGFLKNYRQQPEYKSAASGLRFPFTPRALSGWYVPSPDLVSLLAYLNGRNAEYSGNFASSIARPVLKPDREEKGLAMVLIGDIYGNK